MCISTTTLTSSPSGSTAAGQKQEACSSTGSLSKPSPSDRPRTTPSSATLILPGRPPHWSEGDTIFAALPDDAHGQLVRRGRELIVATYAYIGPHAADPAKRGERSRLRQLSSRRGDQEIRIADFRALLGFPAL